MNAQEAADILGVNRRRHGDLLEMLRALTLYPWLNTAEDEKRRVAVRWVLTHWKEYQDECARRRRRSLVEPGRQVFDADRGEPCGRPPRGDQRARWRDPCPQAFPGAHALRACNRPEIRSVSVPMTRAPRCASGEKQWEMQQGTIHGKHQVRGQPSICITNCAECDGARRRRSRRDDAGGNHTRQRALDCPHQNTNDVGFRPFLTCSIAARDNDGGGAPEAVVIPPCNCSANRGVDSTHYPLDGRAARHFEDCTSLAARMRLGRVLVNRDW